MNDRLIYLFFFIWYHGLVHGQPFAEEMLKFINAEGMRNAGISLSVLDVNSGRLVASHNPNLSLTPASSLKAVTTSTALALLGPNYRFKTELQYDGQILPDTGILTGNLYIKGYGDPTLGSSDLDSVLTVEELMQKWAKVIEDTGICLIQGAIVGDGTHYQPLESIGNNWQWDDLGNYYATGVWGLNIHENYYLLRLQQQSMIGLQPPIVATYPTLSTLKFTNRIVSAAARTGDNTLIFGSPFEQERLVRGTIPVGRGLFSIKSSMADAPLVSAHLLQHALEQRQIATQKEPTALKEPIQSMFHRSTFYTHYSPLLSSIIKRANEESINLYCESLLRAIGKITHNEGTPTTGVETIKNYWKGRGVDLEGFFMEDGSGLSARNAVSSYQLVTILQAIAVDSTLFSPFYASLSKAGETGTLKSLFKNSVAIGRLRAKSGSMTRVRSYTGYVTTTQGRLLAFSFIVNNYACSNTEIRRRLERLMISLCKE